MIGRSKKLLINLPIRLKGKFEKHFWQIKESFGGQEQGSRPSFAEVTNWGYITSGMQARVWVGILYILYRDIPQDSGQIINTFFQPLGPQNYTVYTVNILYGYNSTCALISCFLIMTRHYQLGVQGIYNLCLTCQWTSLWTFMLWSIDSCQKVYPLTSVT